MMSPFPVFWVLCALLSLTRCEYQLFDNPTGSVTCARSPCIISCDNYGGCQNTIIDGSLADELTVICSAQSSCKSMSITAGGQNSTNINCTDIESCSLAQFNLNNSPIVNLNCDYGPESTSTATSSGACYNIYLNTSLSTNVNVDCIHPYSCSFADIHCPLDSHNAECNITCSTDAFSCRFMDIFVKNEGGVNLDCSDGSAFVCLGVEIYCGQTTSAPNSTVADSSEEGWYCSTDGCCPFYNGYKNCDGLPTCTIDCTTTDCSGYLLDGTLAMNSLTVNCDGANGGCRGATIRCPDGISCTVDCKDTNSCKETIIKATDSYSLNLECDGYGACLGADIYCPYHGISSCNIDCSSGDENVCAGIDIIVDDIFNANYLSFLCPNTNVNYSCSGALFMCNADGTTSKTATSLVWTNIRSQYQCEMKSFDYCCPWGNAICSSSECNINCGLSNCWETIINATDSESLNIECGSHECQSSVIYCASNVCNINCIASKGCDGLIVYANVTTTVTINCDSDSACDNMIIYANNANTLTFDSTSYKSNQVKIYADNVGAVSLICNGDYSCYFMEIYADNANSVIMEASSNLGFGYGIFHASNAGFVSIICSSTDIDFGCFDNDWYLPNYGTNTKIYCYNSGCWQFGDIYVDSSVSLLDLNINCCGQHSSESGCISSWTIYCKSNIASTSYSNSEIFHGDSCTNNGDICDCNIMQKDAIFSDDASHLQCGNVTDYSTDYASPKLQIKMTYFLFFVFHFTCFCI